MEEVARRLNENAAWPDRAERDRLTRWLGRIHGFYASGVNIRGVTKTTDRNEFFTSKQNDLKNILPAPLRPAFQDSYVNTQMQVASEVIDLDSKLSAKILGSIQRQQNSLAENLQVQRNLADQQAAVQQNQQAMAEDFRKQASNLEVQYGLLEKTSAQIQVEAANLMPNFLTAQARYNAALAEFQGLNNQLAAGTIVDPTQLQAAQQELLNSSGQLAPLGEELQRLNSRNQVVMRELASIRQQWYALSKAANVAKIKLDQQAQALNGKLANLEKGMLKTAANAASAKTAKGLGLPEKNALIRVRNLERWTAWSDDDEILWLIRSLQAAKGADLPSR